MLKFFEMKKSVVCLTRAIEKLNYRKKSVVIIQCIQWKMMNNINIKWHICHVQSNALNSFYDVINKYQ